MLAIYPSVVVHQIIYGMLSQVHVVGGSVLIICSAMAGSTLLGIECAFHICRLFIAHLASRFPHSIILHCFWGQDTSEREFCMQVSFVE